MHHRPDRRAFLAASTAALAACGWDGGSALRPGLQRFSRFSASPGSTTGWESAYSHTSAWLVSTIRANAPAASQAITSAA
jgi:hypothetical protein